MFYGFLKTGVGPLCPCTLPRPVSRCFHHTVKILTVSKTFFNDSKVKNS